MTNQLPIMSRIVANCKFVCRESPRILCGLPAPLHPAGICNLTASSGLAKALHLRRTSIARFISEKSILATNSCRYSCCFM